MGKLPRMFNKRQATLALSILRQAQMHERGVSPSWFGKSEHYCRANANKAFSLLYRAGVIDGGADRGPRGGFRYKPTPLGELVLDVVEKHGVHYRAALALLQQFEGRMM